VPIAVLCGRAAPGQDGVADYTRHLVDALRDVGTAVELVEVGPGPVGAAQAARRVRALRPELVHLQFAPSAFGFSPWIGLLPDAVDAPVVTTLHEYGWWSAPGWVPAPLWAAVERRLPFDRETWRLAPASAAVVTTNAAHAAALTRRIGRTPAMIPLAPNVADHGVPDTRGVRARLGIPDDARVIAFFGFVHPVKGLRYLIEALARLRHRPEPLHLLVLGGFTSRALPAPEARAFHDELVGRAAACGAADRVTITDHLPAAEVSAALHAADVAAFPFTAGTTTKSGALLSAFAHGLPTLVTAADPADPLLVDGESVVVAPQVRDAVGLAVGLARLLDEEPLCRKVAAGGAALMAGRSWPEIAATHRDVYAEVLRERNG
jgi:glycosyltransferase involved in cell wall biosynthesis